jgi:hypothetical protein
MPIKSSKILLAASLVLVICIGAAILVSRSVLSKTRKTSSVTQAISTGAKARNLSLQPDALKMSRRLGNRFAPLRRDLSLVSGNLIIGTNSQSVTITRQQTDIGERIQIAVGTGTFTWSDAEGAKAPTGVLNDTQRLLIERVVFDSPDWFVLAQLRGASYHVVGRNIRPAEVGGSENYTGPVWDIVRVTDSESDSQKTPFSPWRLYFINSKTGLIDKIVCDLDREQIETTFSDWTVVGGETVPARIVWKGREGTLMEFVLTTFARTSVQ